MQRNDNPAASDRMAAFQQYRGLLFSIAYRMLGTVAEAEDMVQESSAGCASMAARTDRY